MKKKILICTGGSGGHVVPATIFYEHLKNEFDIKMTSDLRGFQFLDRHKYNIEVFNVPKISKNIFILPFQFFLLLYLIVKAYFFLKKHKISILISTGGYMSLPLCMASIMLNTKLFLFEPNIVLGRSNRFFINFCEKIFCYSDMLKKFPNKLKNKIYLIPTLLRKDFYNIKISDKIEDKINLLIIGGSQGAKLFDTAIKDSIIELSKRYRLKIFQQTNPNNYNNLENFYLDNKIENKLFNFSENISDFMIKTNICITRAGASTLAELVFLKIPHIVIPLPSAKDNHQFANASFYQKLGCNWVLNQDDISKIKLVNLIVNIIENKEECLDKKKNMDNFNYQNSWNNINQKIITIINEN